MWQNEYLCEITNKIKEYEKYSVGSFFTFELFSDGRCILWYKYPLKERNPMRIFDSAEDFIMSNCIEVLEANGFSLVKNL